MNNERVFYDSWKELREKLNLSKENLKFRGHRDSNWCIDSSIQRRFDKFDIRSNEAVSKYYLSAAKNQMTSGIFSCQDIEQFENALSRFDFCHKKEPLPPEIGLQDTRIIYNGVLELQHFGTPTHLIDFTRSLFISAYFALFDSMEHLSEDKDHWPCIISIQIPECLKLLDCNEMPEYICERISRQQGEFICCNEYDGFIVLRHMVDPKWAPEIYSELKQMNINGYTLFETPEKASLDHYNEIKYGGLLEEYFFNHAKFRGAE